MTTERRQVDNGPLYLADYPKPGSLTASVNGEPTSVETIADEVIFLADRPIGQTVDLEYELEAT